MQHYKGEKCNMMIPFDSDFFSKTNGFILSKTNCFSLEQEEKIDHLGNRTIIKRIKYAPQKKLIKTEIQEKTVQQDSYEIENEIRSFKTGIIFKDIHEFVTQKVIPKKKNIKLEREVKIYDDGSKEYGEWRRKDNYAYYY